MFKLNVCLCVCLSVGLISPIDGTKGLIPYQTIFRFNDPEEEPFRKPCGKRRKCWKHHFLLFSTMFSTVSKNFNLLVKISNLFALRCI